MVSGTGQGDIQGPPIFNVCLNWAAEIAEKHKAISGLLVLQKGTEQLEEEVITDTDYADDISVSMRQKMVYEKQRIFYPIMPHIRT